MGNESSTPTSDSSYPAAPVASQHSDYVESEKTSPSGDRTRQNSRSEEISSLINFAKSNYETKPDESLSALMQAMTLNSGPEKANQAMRCIQAELERPEASQGIFSGQYPSGHNHSWTTSYLSFDDKQRKIKLISQIVQGLMADRSTYLYQMGRQHILQQAMEDGSSVVCPHCKGVIPVKRLQQHEQYWCTVSVASFQTEVEENDDEME